MNKNFLSAQDLYHIVSVADPRLSPDGRWLAHVRTRIDRATNGYKSAIWLAPTAGGRCRPYTAGDKRDHSPRWSPDGRWLAFVSNRGDEKAKSQIYLMPTDGGEALRLTQMEQGVEEPAWSPDGRWIAFTSRRNAEELAAEDQPAPEADLDPEEEKRRLEEKEKREKEKADPRVIRRFAYREGTSYLDDRTHHLYVLAVDLETGQAQGQPRRLTQDGRSYRQPRWLPDGRGLLVEIERDVDVDDLFYFKDLAIVSLESGEMQVLTQPDTVDFDPRPSPDGQWIAYSSRPVAEFTAANTQLKIMPAAGGQPRTLAADLDNHVYDIRWTPDSQRLVVLVSERGRTDLRIVDREDGTIETAFTADRELTSYDLSADGKQVGFVAATDRAPWDLYIAALDGSGEQRLTRVNDEWLAEKTLGEVQDLWFESADGTPIQAWIVKPPDWKPGARYPMILSIHGGPHVMWSRHASTMWHEWQMQAARGYVVFACNPRGSDGYGRAFRASLLNRWGEADLPDLMAGVERVIAKGYVDPERLVVTGGSYGGFMTAWVIGHDDRFKAAVAQRGVYDLISFYGTSDVPLLAEWEFSTTPWEDPQLLWKYSPVAHVDRIQTPLLLIHSENDFRAPIPAAEGLFVALRRLKRTVEMVRYPRDGHELSRSGEPKHRVDRLERIVDWFDRFVQQAQAD